jgi:AIR synthase-related protein
VDHDILALLGDVRSVAARPAFHIEPADHSGLTAYRALRHEAFVARQGLFAGHDLDDHDTDPRTIVLVARDTTGDVLGGVRLGPATDGPDFGWWRGGRLVVAPGSPPGIGSALVRAACARAEAEGGPLLRDLTGGPGFVGDDGVPLPGTDVVAACDAIVPAMVERDPEWAGWCSVLVNLNDLAAMGATPTGLLDALGARDASFAARVLSGLRKASEAYGVPVLGGHTQFGVPASLSVTALGRTTDPVPGGGGQPGQRVWLSADLGGGWRPGYTGRQWDSTSFRRTPELRELLGSVAKARPAAAKDVSMAGIAGTLGMLAEASGCGAVLDVERVPRPRGASTGDWLTCFPGFAMLTTGAPAPAGSAVTAVCGELVAGTGVTLRWPDGELTTAIDGGVTGLGNS